MRHVLLFGTAMLMVMTPTPAVHANEGVQLVRAGDSTMTCEALTAEINSLAVAQQAAAAQPSEAQPKKRKRGGFGFLTQALQVAAPVLGGGLGGAGGMIASQVAGAAQSASMNAQVDAQMDMANRAAAAAVNAITPSIANQRKERLMGLFEAKRC